MLSRLIEIDPSFTMMEELHRRMQRVWEDVDPSWQRTTPSGRTSSPLWPKINVHDEGTNLVLVADLPGFSEHDVQVTLDDSGLTLAGERKRVALEGYSAHREERRHSKFERSVTLPFRANPEKTTATVKNGVLTITLTKSAEAEPRRITVRAQ